MRSFVLSTLVGKYSLLRKYNKGTRSHYTLFDSKVFFFFLQDFFFFLEQCYKMKSSFYFISFIKLLSFFFFNFFKKYSNLYFVSVPYPGFLSNFNYLLLGSLKTSLTTPTSFLMGSNFSKVSKYSVNSSLIFLDYIKKSSFMFKELSKMKGFSFGQTKQDSINSQFFYPLVTDTFFKGYAIFYLTQIKELFTDFWHNRKRKKIFWKKKFRKLRRGLKLGFNWYRLFYLYSFVFFKKCIKFFFINNYSFYAKKKILFYYSRKKKKQKFLKKQKIFQKQKFLKKQKKKTSFKTSFSRKNKRSQIFFEIFTNKFLSKKVSLFKKKSFFTISKCNNGTFFRKTKTKRLFKNIKNSTKSFNRLKRKNTISRKISNSVKRRVMNTGAPLFYSISSKKTAQKRIIFPNIENSSKFILENFLLNSSLVLLNERKKSLQLKKKIEIIGKKHQNKKDKKNSCFTQFSRICKGFI